MIEIDRKRQISINNPFDQNRRGFSKIIQNLEFYKKKFARSAKSVNQFIIVRGENATRMNGNTLVCSTI